MKQGLAFMFLLLATTSLWGQVEMHGYDFSKMKGVDSIVVHITSNGASWKEMFYYQNDRRTKATYLDKSGLSHYRLFQYDDKRQLRFESYYAKSLKFDVDKDDWIEFWDSSTCWLSIKRFSGSQLIEEKKCDVNGPDTTIRRITTYTYDANRRILSEVTRDVFVGLVGSFKSNSADLKEFGEKKETIVYSSTYKYHPGKIEVLYKVNETLTGREIVGLDGEGRVTSINQYDPRNVLLSEKTASYDEKGRLVFMTWKSHSAISIWGREGDVAADGTETMEYDNLGRPAVKRTINPGNHETKTEYRYY